jgi:hypothetical protein
MRQTDSSEPKYESIEQFKKLSREGYMVSRISYPPTSDGSASIMIDLVQPSRHQECLLTVFGEEAIVLSEFVKNPSSGKQKGDIVEQ